MLNAAQSALLCGSVLLPIDGKAAMVDEVRHAQILAANLDTTPAMRFITSLSMIGREASRADLATRLRDRWYWPTTETLAMGAVLHDVALVEAVRAGGTDAVLGWRLMPPTVSMLLTTAAICTDLTIAQFPEWMREAVTTKRRAWGVSSTSPVPGAKRDRGHALWT